MHLVPLSPWLGLFWKIPFILVGNQAKAFTLANRRPLYKCSKDLKLQKIVNMVDHYVSVGPC